MKRYYSVFINVMAAIVSDLDRLYDTVKQQKGRIDVLFVNAGIIGLLPLESITEDHFDKMFSI
jgi:NAD(P)-dependent dehydrogenase (short-subunit alcohol dehydrogenase family)